MHGVSSQLGASYNAILAWLQLDAIKGLAESKVGYFHVNNSVLIDLGGNLKQCFGFVEPINDWSYSC